MALDIATHKTILFQILKELYSDTTVAPFLGFKGGTAALMFYQLNRFSVDLDFDLLNQDKEDYVFDRVTSLLKKFGTLKESYKKRFNLFWLLSYEDNARNVKVEINRRHFDSKYEIKTYLGVSMLIMVPEDMFAHKLMSMYERMGKANRDIYDVWFFLEHRFPINKKLIEQRSRMPFNKFMDKCLEKLGEISNRNILSGIGELLTPNQKDWTKAKLLSETIALLKLRLP